MPSHPLLDELQWRGLVYQQTEGLADALRAGTVTGYIGFDPTASSLHVGSLVPIMGLVHLQRHGHRPIALVGGGTGMIGDPSGKASERALLDGEQVAENARGIRSQLERFLDFDATDNAAAMANNADWLTTLGAIEFLRDTGKHFTVNYMMQKESVKARLETGISFTEFAYMLLQAHDFLELHRRRGATLQMGGSDQWGNITAGIELIRRVAGAEAQGLTLPLVTTSSGIKFGKTEAGTIWLDAERTSPYRFYQFWINVDDRDVGRYVRYFTLLSRDEVEALDQATAERPEKREAQQALARDVTGRVHGETAVRAAQEATRFIFGAVPARELSTTAIETLRNEIPVFTSSSLDVTAILEAATKGEEALFKSKSDARRMVQQGGVRINDERVTGDTATIQPTELLMGRFLVLQKGARNKALVEVPDSTR